MGARLLTLGPSHYAEKARWALDWAKVPYREERLSPGFHFVALRRLNAKTAPVFVTERGDVLRDSTDIVKSVPALFPTDEVARLEDELDTRFGPLVRDWVYSWLMRDGPRVRALFAPGLSRLEVASLTVFVPLARRRIISQYELDSRSVDEHFERLWACWAELETRFIDDGHPFDGADLTLAALGAHAVAAEGFRGSTVALDDRPAVQRDRTRALRDSKLGRFILRLYRDQRGAAR